MGFALNPLTVPSSLRIMKPFVILCLAVAIAFAAGWRTGEARAVKPTGNGPPDEETNTRSRSKPTRAEPRGSAFSDAERLRSAGGDEVATAALPVLREGPPIDRLRRFLMMLDGMTADNWESLLKAMSDETSGHGRFQQLEWDLALRQAGRVDGPRAAARYAALNQDDSLRKVLAGWAQTDPDAAWAWIGQYKDERGRRDVWRGALIGIAETDPDEAMKRLDSLPFEVKGGTISFLVGPMIQAEGIDATAERIRDIYQEYSAKDPTTISAKEHEFVYAFFHNVCDIKRNAGYTPEKRMEALELLASFPDLARRSPWLIPRTVASAARDNPQRVMEIVSSLCATNEEVLHPEGVEQAARAWNEKDPAGFRDWIEANRGKPVADRAAGVVQEP